jgi:hypothetical protein
MIATLVCIMVDPSIPDAPGAERGCAALPRYPAIIAV